MSSPTLARFIKRLDTVSTFRCTGRVVQAVGHLVESEGPSCSLGESCEILSADGHAYEGETVGFRGSNVLSMPLKWPEGLRYGDRVVTHGHRPSVRVGLGMLGRVLDGRGVPMDGQGDFAADEWRVIDGTAPLPLQRNRVTEPVGTGVRALDGFTLCGLGQRIGIFGGSGVGKTTLLGMMTRSTSADLSVIGLIGERGREVGEFLHELGDAGRARSVVVASTSDQSPLMRIRAAATATTIAEYFCMKGKNVLLFVDSLTRVAMAQREIGLAAGEPPTAKGYTPSVYTLLARLCERAGRFGGGSITGVYTVLMEGDDQQDPLVDNVRSLLDGHIILDRRLAIQNHFPPISVADSLSRLMSVVATPEHNRSAQVLRRLLAVYANSEDLIRIGAYQKGTDPELDQAIAVLPALKAFLIQTPNQQAHLPQTVAALRAITGN